VKGRRKKIYCDTHARVFCAGEKACGTALLFPCALLKLMLLFYLKLLAAFIYKVKYVTEVTRIVGTCNEKRE
jgi:hypothetical protein